VVATDGQEALVRFEREHIDLLLLDLNLPRKNGWDVFERVTGHHPLLPIIIITGRDKQRELAAAAGVSALMEKPLNISLLLETVSDLLNQPAEDRLRRLADVDHAMRYFPAATLSGLGPRPLKLKPAAKTGRARSLRK
jgi:DNA-binding response OmpR family regulator